MSAVLIVVALAIATVVGAQLFLRSVEDPIGTAIPVYALLLPFGSGIRIPLPLPSAFGTLSSLVGAWAVVALALHLYTRRRPCPTHATVCTLFVLALGAISFTYLWSIDPPTTGQNVFILVGILGLFVLGALVEVDRRSLRRVEICAVVGAVAACAYGLWLLQSGRLASNGAGPARFATAGGIGDQADPNITAATLVLPFLLALLFTLGARRPLERFAAFAATIVIGVGILLTGSRGGALAAVAGTIIVVWHYGGRRVLARSSVVLAIGAAIALLALPSTISSRFGQSTSTGRTSIWTVGLHACETYCWRGSGWGTFPTVYNQTVLSHPSLAIYNGVLTFKSHNVWLEIVVEGGIVALALVVAAIAILFRSVWTLPTARRAAPLAGLVALLISNEFLSNFNFKYFWFVLLYAALALNVRAEISSPVAQASEALGTRGSYASRGTTDAL
jgi:O-antigen ligase